MPQYPTILEVVAGFRKRSETIFFLFILMSTLYVAEGKSYATGMLTSSLTGRIRHHKTMGADPVQAIRIASNADKILKCSLELSIVLDADNVDSCAALRIIGSKWDNGCAELFTEIEAELGNLACLAASACLGSSLGPIRGVCWPRCENSKNIVTASNNETMTKTVTECKPSMLDKAGMNHEAVCGDRLSEELVFSRMGFAEVVIQSGVCFVFLTMSVIYTIIGALVMQIANPGQVSYQIVEFVFLFLDIVCASYTCIRFVKIGVLEGGGFLCALLTFATAPLMGPIFAVVINITAKLVSIATCQGLNSWLAPVVEKSFGNLTYEQCQSGQDGLLQSVEELCRQHVNHRQWESKRDRVAVVDKHGNEHLLSNELALTEDDFPIHVVLKRKVSWYTVVVAHVQNDISGSEEEGNALEHVGGRWLWVLILVGQPMALALLPFLTWYMFSMLCLLAVFVPASWAIIAFPHITVLSVVLVIATIGIGILITMAIHLACITWVKQTADAKSALLGDGKLKSSSDVFETFLEKGNSKVLGLFMPMVLALGQVTVALPIIFGFFMFIHADYARCHQAFFEEFSIPNMIIPRLDFNLNMFFRTLTDIFTLSNFNFELSVQELTNLAIASSLWYAIVKGLQLLLQAVFLACHLCSSTKVESVKTKDRESESSIRDSNRSRTSKNEQEEEKDQERGLRKVVVIGQAQQQKGLIDTE